MTPNIMVGASPKCSQSSALGATRVMAAPTIRFVRPYGTPTISSPASANTRTLAADCRMP